MRILGYTIMNLLSLMLLGTTLALFISLPISQTNDNTLGESIFGRSEPHQEKKRKVKQESDWKKYYGSCPELKEDIKEYGKEFFSRVILSLHEKKGDCNFEETKQLFLNNVLSEALDNGAPAYYNSNILGRYMRKDYGNFGKNPASDSRLGS